MYELRAVLSGPTLLAEVRNLVMRCGLSFVRLREANEIFSEVNYCKYGKIIYLKFISPTAS